MPAPYTIQESSDLTGLSVKFIRRLKDALPGLFEKHTDRGHANALLFDEELIEVLRRIRDMKGRGKTLNQIKREISEYTEKHVQKLENSEETDENLVTNQDTLLVDHEKSDGKIIVEGATGGIVEKQSLERENAVLRSQIDLLQELLRNAENRFDRLLPEGKKLSTRSQFLLWIVEAVVVTVFACGFIFLIWFFAQRAFA